MSRKKYITAVALLGLAILVLPGCTKKNTQAQGQSGSNVGSLLSTAALAFHADKVTKVGNHTYYSEDVYGNRDMDDERKKALMERMEKADETLTEDVYVYGFGESETRGEFRFYGYAYQAGIVLEDIAMGAWYGPANGYVWSRRAFTKNQQAFDSQNLASFDDVLETVYEDAKENKDQMVKERINGFYVLKAKENGELYYEFRINRYSTVKVDAKTGTIIQAYYFDGIYT